MPCVNADDSPILEVCECGQVYLRYGSVTLAFQYAEFVKYARHVTRLADTVIERRGITATVVAGKHSTH